MSHPVNDMIVDQVIDQVASLQDHQVNDALMARGGPGQFIVDDGVRDQLADLLLQVAMERPGPSTPHSQPGTRSQRPPTPRRSQTTRASAGAPTRPPCSMRAARVTRWRRGPCMPWTMSANTPPSPSLRPLPSRRGRG